MRDWTNAKSRFGPIWPVVAGVRQLVARAAALDEQLLATDAVARSLRVADGLAACREAERHERSEHETDDDAGGGDGREGARSTRATLTA